MSLRQNVLIAFCLWASTLASAWADGAELYLDNCSSCHGEAGEGSADIGAPVLAGQQRDYLRRQMVQLGTDWRKLGEDDGMALAMVDVLSELDEAGKDAIATYLSALPKPEIEQEVAPPGFRGRGLYSGCSSCHGAGAEGNENLQAPRLAGQYPWYIAAQLHAFRGGRRGTHPEDKPGSQMKSMADAIASDADIEQIVSYIASLAR